MRIRHLIALLVLLVMVSLPSPAQAGGVVTVCDEANLVAALTGGGTVTFACSGTITLTHAKTIAANTTIDGGGQDVIISGNNTTDLFFVNNGVVLNLSHLTLANGDGFGSPNAAVFNNRGTLNVSDSIFSENAGGTGVIYNLEGTVNIADSIFSDNVSSNGIFNIRGTVDIANTGFMGDTLASRGRDIYNSHGTVTVSNSAFANDPVGGTANGGGIHNFGGTLNVINSTFSGNRAYNGGAINNENPGAVTVSNSTFHGNKATNLGGGICSQNAGTVVVTNSTFFGNEAAGGGGVVNVGTSLTFTLKNTIVANSPAGNNCFGMITDGGRNLSYPDASCPGINADPMLGPLQMNGGPTMTMGLGPGSAAIDAGDDATCAASPVNNLDQRGVSRPVGPHCDIGAFETIYLTMPVRAWLPIVMAQ